MYPSLALQLAPAPPPPPEGMMSDDERLRKGSLIRMWKQRIQNLEPLKKTRPDYCEKQKKILNEVREFIPRPHLEYAPPPCPHSSLKDL